MPKHLWPIFLVLGACSASPLSSVDSQARKEAGQHVGDVVRAVPQVKLLSPMQAAAGDTVVAKGSFERPGTGPVAVRFHDRWIVPEAVSGEEVSFKVPDLPGGKYSVQILSSHSLSEPVDFQLAAGVRTAYSFAPRVDHLPVSTRLLLLEGTGFVPGGEVHIGDIRLPVIEDEEAEPTRVTADWPRELPPGTYDVRFAADGISSRPVEIDVRPTLLYFSPENVRGGETVVGHGANLGDEESVYLGVDLQYGYEITAPVSGAEVTGVTFSVPVTAGSGIAYRWRDEDYHERALTIWPSIDSVTPATAVTGETLTIRGRNLGWGGITFIPEDRSASITLGGTEWPCPCEWYPTVITVTVPATMTPGEKSIWMSPYERSPLSYVYAATTVTISP